MCLCIVPGPTNAPTTPGLPLTTDRINSIPRKCCFLFHFQNRVLNFFFLYKKNGKKPLLLDLSG